MNWSEVGSWIKNNAGPGAALIGSLMSGNVPGAMSAGVALVSSATGTNDPSEALAALQGDPMTLVKLKELAQQNEADIRRHLETMERLKLEDRQHEHEQQQKTIRAGDTAEDPFIRHTRPTMAKESWTATVAYCIGCFGVHAISGTDLFNAYIAGILSAPAWAYIGFRTGDKFAAALGKRK